MLPNVPNKTGVPKSTILQFGGYDHRRAAGNGTIWDMENLSADEAPLLSPRKPRTLMQTIEHPNGIYAGDELYLADGTKLYRDGVRMANVTDTPKTFAQLGVYTCVWPDKIALLRDGPAGWQLLQHELSYLAVFEDGTLYGEPAEGNTLRSIQTDPGSEIPLAWYGFKEGDAVKISSAGIMPENEQTIIIREISQNKQELRFYENSFTTGGPVVVTVTREVPDLDFVCVNENRLWGCRGDTIYASKLGDPYNWNVFDGLSTDSWAVEVGTEGDFTGCISYLGYPCFFKENHIYKVYGDKPSNFHVMQSASLGVEPGSGQSLAIAGEVLFYLSRAGIMAYTGGIPSSIGAPFGAERYRGAVAGSDGLKYYVCMEDGSGDRHLFVYDTRTGLWHREDGFDAMGFAWYRGGLWAQNRDGGLWVIAGSANPPETDTETDPPVQEETVESFAEFGDFDEGSPQRKGHSHVELRAELEADSALTVKIQYDSDGVWHEAGRLEAGRKRSEYLPIIPRRCDHWRIRLEGTGMWYVYSLTRNFYTGSEFH